jgi:phage terminase small subunit
MGLRGPLRDKDSVRGARENAVTGTAVQRAPEPPNWLTAPEKKIFVELVEQAIAANMPLLEIDNVAYAMIAKLSLAVRKETSATEIAKCMRTLLPWMQAAGLTAIGRARLGVKQVEKKESATARLLQMAARRPS